MIDFCFPHKNKDKDKDKNKGNFGILLNVIISLNSNIAVQ